MFIDSDDWLEKDMFEKMMQYSEETNFIICGYKKIFEENKIIYSEIEEKKINQNLAFEYFAERKLQGYACNKIFSLKIIKEKNIRFPNEISICEDLCFIIKYLEHVESIYCINECFYNYRIRNNSAVNDKNNVKKRISILDAYEMLINYYERKKIKSHYLKFWILKEVMCIKRMCKSHNDIINYNTRCKMIIKKYFNYHLFIEKNIKIKDKINIIATYFYTSLICLKNKLLSRNV